MRFSALKSSLPSIALKAFAIGLFSFIFLLAAVNTSLAQTSTTTLVGNATPNYSPNLDSNVPKDQHSHIQATMIEVISAMICQLSGYDPIREDRKCLGVNPDTGKIGFAENGGGGAIGAMGGLISYTFTPPASTSQYVNYLAGNFGITEKAFAQQLGPERCRNASNSTQGYGFCGIEPLIKIWIAMRNIAYLLFVLIFVLIGLAIMLRVHIDPRTVMTIENQIPKIIIGIILVTFSFAIAGFLVDVMYVAIYLVGGFLANIPGHEIAVRAPDGSLVTGFNDLATSPTPFDAINRLWPGINDASDDQTGMGGGFSELAAQGSETVKTLIMNVLGGGPENPEGIIKAESLSYGVVDLIGNGITGFVGFLVGVFAILVIFIALIYTAIRLWIILLVSYINVLLDIIFAPFWILIGLLPGSSMGAGAWFKDILANLAVFPTTVSMFVLAKVFSNIARDNEGYFFVPPLAGGGVVGENVFAGIIALGFLFMTPHVLQITRSAIKAPNINYGPVFQPVGEAGSSIGSGVSTFAAMNAKVPLPGQKGGREALMRRIFKF